MRENPILYEHQSIFGDTVHGVENPRRVLYQNYPSLYHGPNWRYPRFDMSRRTWRENPWTMPLQPSPIIPLSGDGAAPLFQSSTGSMLLDALLGAGAGFMVAPDKDKKAWAIGGAAAAAFAGTVGLLGIIGLGIYKRV